MKKKFGDRFTLIEGDSRITVPEYAASHSSEKFDLIFIDGGHTFDCCLSDIQNCSLLSHPETLVLIDDYTEEVKAAVETCVQAGLIEILEIKHTQGVYITNINGGDRIWAVAQYVTK